MVTTFPVTSTCRTTSRVRELYWGLQSPGGAGGGAGGGGGVGGGGGGGKKGNKYWWSRMKKVYISLFLIYHSSRADVF